MERESRRARSGAIDGGFLRRSRCAISSRSKLETFNLTAMGARRLTQSLPDLKLPCRLQRSARGLRGILRAGEAGSGALSEPKAGQLRLQLNSTMESVAEVEAAADKLAAEAGLDED